MLFQNRINELILINWYDYKRIADIFADTYKLWGKVNEFEQFFHVDLVIDD